MPAQEITMKKSRLAVAASLFLRLGGSALALTGCVEEHPAIEVRLGHQRSAPAAAPAAAPAPPSAAVPAASIAAP
jgi:hypothetical protein